jgi:hypothetical protein
MRHLYLNQLEESAVLEQMTIVEYMSNIKFNSTHGLHKTTSYMHHMVKEVIQRATSKQLKNGLGFHVKSELTTCD